MVHVRLKPTVHQHLRLIVAAEDTSVQNWLAQLIEKTLSEQPVEISRKARAS